MPRGVPPDERSQKKKKDDSQQVRNRTRNYYGQYGLTSYDSRISQRYESLGNEQVHDSE